MLANKIDVPKAASEAEMACELGLDQLQWSVGADGQAGVRLFPCVPRQPSLLLSALERLRILLGDFAAPIFCPSKNGLRRSPPCAVAVCLTGVGVVVVRCSVLKRVGYKEAFQWLSSHLD